jgi:copper(I)-binding protein
MPSSRRWLREPRRALGVFPAGALIAAVLTLAGCAAGATPAPTAAVPVVSGAWVRPPAGMDRPAAGYLTISNPGSQADALVGASSGAATSVEIHETTMMSGMTGMHAISRLLIPAGGSVELKPGGYHLMLMGATTLTVGTFIQLELTFEKAGKVTVTAEVKSG